MSSKRGFLGLIACLVAFASCGEESTTPADGSGAKTIAFLRAFPGDADSQEIVFDELRTRGFVLDRNLRALAVDPDVVYPDPEEAADAVRGWSERGVDLIFAYSTTGAFVAAEHTPETNVLFISNDPSATGLVANEERPEGRMTGVTFRVPADRTLDLARRTLGGLKRIGLIYAQEDPASEPHRRAVMRAARSMGILVSPRGFETEDDARLAIARLATRRVGAVFLSNSPTAVAMLGSIQTAAKQHGLPLIANTAVATEAVVVLDPEVIELNRQLGRQAARLLSGASVSSVPVEDPNRFRVILNAAVAEQLGIELPPRVLRQADDVIGLP